MITRLCCVALATVLPLFTTKAQTADQPSAVPKDSARQDSIRKKKPRVEVSGYVQVFFKTRREVSGDGVTEPDVFRVQRARIMFKGDVTRHVAFDVEIDPRAPEITGILRDAFIALDYIPRHEIRIGQQKTQFGYENMVSSSRLFTVNRTEVSDNLSRGINLRDIGVGLIGSLRLSDKVRIEDAITVMNGAGMNVQEDNTYRKNVWGRLGVRYRSGDVTMRLGASAGSGDVQVPGDPGPPIEEPFLFTFTRLGGDVSIDLPQLFFAGEFVSGNDKLPGDLADEGGNSLGYYATAAGKTRWKAGPIARFDVFEEFRRVTVGGYLGLPTDDVSLLFNYEIFKDDAGKHDDRVYLRLQVRY